MSEIALDVPWASTPLDVAPHRPMTGVDVLPGYASVKTLQTSMTLSQPWSGQALAVAHLPEVESLEGMLLS